MRVHEDVRSQSSVGKPRGYGGKENARGKCWLWAAALSFMLLPSWAVKPAGARAQESKSKVPILSKIEGGSTRQAFTGKVESLDAKRNLLNVNPIEGTGTEIFPVKKSVQVESANGGKLKLSELESGCEVIIYYEQKHGRRTVKKIVELSPASHKAEKKSAPPS
jgi:hypothetical protein